MEMTGGTSRGSSITPSGPVTRQVLRDGREVAYGYYADGNLLTSAGDLALDRDPLNGFLRSTHLGGVTTRAGYTAFGGLSGHTAWANGALVFARTYQRDDLGRITQVEDFADGVTTVWAYGYDAVGRLDTVTRDGAVHASYAYDANGNRLSRTSPLGVETGVYDVQDRLLEYAGAEYTYTANGEFTMKVEGADTTRYDYDVFGNLLRVDLADGTVIEYVIDGRNRRVGKKVDGVLVQGFLYGDQLNPVAELDGAGNVVSRFIYASRANVPDYMLHDGAVFSVLADHLGSVRMVINVASGVVAQRRSYDARGRLLDDSNPGFQPFGYAGGIHDVNTELTRFGSRDYSPTPGRWTAKDPLGFAGGSANLYSYVTGDPVNLADPTGLCPSQKCKDPCDCMAPDGPPNEDVDKNIRKAERRRLFGYLAWFAYKVQPRGDWDWKSQGYEDFVTSTMEQRERLFSFQSRFY